jgi:hypothetical protein
MGERADLGVLVGETCAGQCQCDIKDRVGVISQHAFALLLRLARENLVEDEAVAVVITPIRAGAIRWIDQGAARRTAELKAHDRRLPARGEHTRWSLPFMASGGCVGGTYGDRGNDEVTAATGGYDGGLALSKGSAGPGGGHGMRCCSPLRMPWPFYRHECARPLTSAVRLSSRRHALRRACSEAPLDGGRAPLA